MSVKRDPESLAIIMANCELAPEFQYDSTSNLRTAYLHYTTEYQEISDSNIPQFMTIELRLDPRIGVISEAHQEIEEARKLVIATTMTGIKQDLEEATRLLEAAYKNSPANLTQTQILQALNQDITTISDVWKELQNATTTSAASSNGLTQRRVVER